MHSNLDSNMADESVKVVDVPVPLPPPPLPTVLFKERRNLMKSPASLIGKENGTNVTRSALDLCRSFVCSHAERTPEARKLTWFCCNNDVEAFLQDGPTCGLIALKLAADILKTSGSLASLPTTGENEIAELLQLSKESCFTYWGEMFSAKDMVSLARMYYGMNYQVGSSGLEDYMKVVNHIVQGYPVLVPYDADRNNEPCLKRGHKAHWVVVTGCLIGLEDTETKTQTCIDSYEEIPVYPLLKDGKSSLPSSFGSKDLFLIVRHGKSRHCSLWPWVDLYKSNNNLFEFDPVELQNIEKSNGRRCLFTEGVLPGLCSKVLFYCPS